MLKKQFASELLKEIRMKNAFDKAYEKMTPRQQELVKIPLNQLTKMVECGQVTWDELHWLINFHYNIKVINEMNGD